MNFINGIYQLYRWKQESVIFYFNKKDLIIRCYQKRNMKIYKLINSDIKPETSQKLNSLIHLLWISTKICSSVGPRSDEYISIKFLSILVASLKT